MGRKPIDRIVDMAVMVTERARSALNILKETWQRENKVSFFHYHCRHTMHAYGFLLDLEQLMTNDTILTNKTSYCTLRRAKM
jgi:hypothetical protein